MNPPPPALADLYQREYASLVGLLTVVGGDRTDAEEVAQDAFVRLLENWSKVSHYEDPTAWLRTVAVRLLISRRRRGQVSRGKLPLLASSDAAKDSSPVARLDLDQAFGQLSVSHRAVLVLHHLYDLPLEDVARHLKVPVGTVKSRLARARAALVPLLGDAHERRAT